MKIPESAKGKSFVEHQSTKTSKDCYVLGNKKHPLYLHNRKTSGASRRGGKRRLLEMMETNLPQQNACGGLRQFFLVGSGTSDLRVALTGFLKAVPGRLSGLGLLPK